jgi:hypothetical protein
MFGDAPRTGPLMFPNAGDVSNAKKSKNAKDATQAAKDASDRSSNSDPDSHRRAQDAHWQAADANRQAGNDTLAKKHQAIARVHGEKANANEDAKYFAQGEARKAQELTQKAEKSGFGKDSMEPRSTQQLHQDAAQAHDRAAKAFDLAGMDTESKYHAAKAGAHAKMADPGSASTE